MTDVPRKIIITGTGRAGTTFLVRLLTELGLDTGFTRENWREHFHAHCAAGLEIDLAAPDTPRIVKDPELCERLPAILAAGRIVVEHALVPVRELEAAAASRVRVGANVPGGLVGTQDATRQRAVLAERFHHLVETLVRHDIPHTFLAFPRFACDAAYCYERLQVVLGGVTFAEFEAAFKRVADPALIHQFRPGEKPRDAGAPSRAYRWAWRLRKWPRRFAVALALVAVGLALGARRTRVVAPESPATHVERAPAQEAARGRGDFYTLLHLAFQAGDENGDGNISEEELAWLAAIDPDLEAEFQRLAGKRRAWDELYASLDLDHDGRVSEPEFVAKVASVARRSDGSDDATD
ncbi:MAG: hypothetical protein HYV96_12755 [Opitutae bacterium]|nr:hypothetical protein [Opitutae bacterium]